MKLFSNKKIVFIKEQKLSDVLFVISFCIALLIPISHVNGNDVSLQEKRELATLQPLILPDGHINNNFGKNFDAWFSDRFNYREQLIKVYNLLCMYISGETNKGIVDQKTGFVYLGKNFTYFDSHANEQFFEPLFKLNELLKKQNIDLYVLFMPSVKLVYASEKTGTPKELIDLIDKINKSKRANIIYPYDAIMEASKQEYTHFKTDYHMTDYGAFVAYTELMKRIKNDYPNIKILRNDDFNYSYNTLVRCGFNRKYQYGYSSVFLGLPNQEKYHTTNYRYYNHKDFDTRKSEIFDDLLRREKEFSYPRGVPLRVLEIGDSMNDNIVDFISFTFKNSKYIRINEVKGKPHNDEFKIMKYYKKEIDDYNPNIVIFVVNNDNIPRLSSVMEE